MGAFTLAVMLFGVFLLDVSESKCVQTKKTWQFPEKTDAEWKAGNFYMIRGVKFKDTTNSADIKLYIIGLDGKRISKPCATFKKGTLKPGPDGWIAANCDRGTFGRAGFIRTSEQGLRACGPDGKVWLAGRLLCLPGQMAENGVCKKVKCPTGQVLKWGTQCGPIKCPTGQVLKGSKCEPIQCPTGQQLVKGGECRYIRCRAEEILIGNKCELMHCKAYQKRVGSTCQCEYGKNGSTCYTNPTDRCTFRNSCQAGSSYRKFYTDWRSCINTCDREGSRCKGICWDTAKACWLLDPITTNKFYKHNGSVLYYKNCPNGYRY